MATAPYPSLDAGFINDPGKKLSCLMSDFYESEYSQSYIFQGSISSLPWILQQNQNNPDEAIIAIRQQLEGYLLKYFDSATVETGVTDTINPNQYSIRLYVRITQGDEVVTLYNQLKIVGTKLQESIQLRE